MKDKKKIYESIFKEIKKGFARIKWLTITNINYYFRYLISKKKLKFNSIAILIPTKQRVDKLYRFIESLINKTSKLNRIYILILIDQNERDKIKYFNLVESLKKKINIILYEKDEKTHNIRNNFLASQIDADLYFPMNDDVIFTLKNWDLYIDKIERLIPYNKPYSIWIKSDVKYNYLHCDFPIVNKLWFNRLNYIGNLYLFGYIDTWICELSKLSKNFIVTKEKMINHLNVGNKDSKEIKDNTYFDLMKFQEDDKKKWIETKHIRIKDATKLS